MVIFSLRSKFLYSSLFVTIFFSANTDCMLSECLEKTKRLVPKIIPTAFFFSSAAGSRTVLDCFDECVSPEYIQNFSQCFYGCKNNSTTELYSNDNSYLHLITVFAISGCILSFTSLSTCYCYYKKMKLKNNKQESFYDFMNNFFNIPKSYEEELKDTLL